MAKTYLHRVYNGGRLVQTWGGPSSAQVPVTSEPSLSAEVDGGLSPLSISLALPWDYAGEDLTTGNVVETWCVEDGQETLLHAGFLATKDEECSASTRTVAVTVTPYVAQLADDFFRDGATGTTIAHTWTTTDVSTILTAIVDKCVVRAGTFSRVHHTATSVADSGVLISVQVGAETYLDAIRRVKAMGPGDWYWHVAADGTFSYRNFDSGTRHTLTLGRELDRVKRTEDTRDLRNVVSFWNGFDTAASAIAFERSTAASVATYGRRSELLTDTRIDDLATAQQLADRYLRERDHPLVTVEASVLAQDGRLGYPIETIRVGDTVEFRGVPSLDGQTLCVVRTDYSPSSLGLTLADGPAKRTWSLGRTIEEMYQYVRTQLDGSPVTDTTA